MKYFGTDGFRGEANVGLTVEHAYKIGRFVGWYYGANRGAKARVIVGKDTRRSSYMFEAALVSGLVASGADAYMLHVIPTPGVAHQTVEGCFDCGIMISASHNPFCDNGIKLVNSDGFKMDEDVLELIEDYIDGKSEVPLATGNHIGARWTTCRVATATLLRSSPARTFRCRASRSASIAPTARHPRWPSRCSTHWAPMCA